MCSYFVKESTCAWTCAASLLMCSVRVCVRAYLPTSLPTSLLHFLPTSVHPSHATRVQTGGCPIVHVHDWMHTTACARTPMHVRARVRPCTCVCACAFISTFA